ncbi:hypothetical protein B0O99DRAFT_744249 [Bisporella sp. PMI_857]|nr:hypothetical protein B0O99DRAFT_744249 [Bisporella sp. PMI_857]
MEHSFPGFQSRCDKSEEEVTMTINDAKSPRMNASSIYQQLEYDPMCAKDEIFTQYIPSKAGSLESDFTPTLQARAPKGDVGFLASNSTSVNSEDDTSTYSNRRFSRTSPKLRLPPPEPVPAVPLSPSKTFAQTSFADLRISTPNSCSSYPHLQRGGFRSSSSTPQQPQLRVKKISGKPSSSDILFPEEKSNAEISLGANGSNSPSPGPGPTSMIRPNLFPIPILNTSAPRDSVQRSPQLSDNEWLRIQELRRSTWSLRSRVQEMRKILREKQYVKSAADDRCIRYMREQALALSTEQHTGLQFSVSSIGLLEDCQKARDDYGPLEDDCNQLEDELSRNEYELTKCEESFFQKRIQPGFSIINTQQSSVRPSSSDTSLSDVSDSTYNYHPLVSTYLSKLGDIDILQERLAEKIEERLILEDGKESKQLVGLDLGVDDQAWLNDSEFNETKLRKQIAETEKEADILKEECIMKGLMDADGNPTSFQTQEKYALPQDLDAGSEASDYVKYPLLLSKPGQPDISFHELAPSSQDITSSAGDHINHWLLHKLRLSPLDVNLLASISDKLLSYITGEEWQTCVLKLWYQDDTRKLASKYRIIPTDIMSETPPESLTSPTKYVEDQVWLGDSQELLGDLKTEIIEKETEVEWLRKECLKFELIDENGDPVNDILSQEQRIFADERGISADGEASEYVKYPSLLPRPATREYKPHHHDQNSDEKAGRNPQQIDTWLLDILQDPALYVLILASTSDQVSGTFNDRRAKEVLKTRYRDGTGKDSRVCCHDASSNGVMASVYSEGSEPPSLQETICSIQH